jgi:hypothetical protein
MGDRDDYSDEKIRLYIRVLRRMIILTAVIVGIPVMMLTVTVAMLLVPSR